MKGGGNLAKSYPKAHFSNRLPNGDYLSFSIWPGKKDPSAEVLTIQIRRQIGDNWETVGRLAVYRTATGDYRELPERMPPTRTNGTETQTQESTIPRDASVL